MDRQYCVIRQNHKGDQIDNDMSRAGRKQAGEEKCI